MTYDRRTASSNYNYKPQVKRIEDAIKALLGDLAEVVKDEEDFGDVTVEKAAFQKLSQLQKDLADAVSHLDGIY